MQAEAGAALSSTGAPPASRRRVGLLLLIGILVLVIDQATKWLAVTTLSDGSTVRLVDGLLTLRLVRNPGAAFSFATGYTVVLTAVAGAVVIGILRVARRLRSLAWAIGLGGLLGGALGNLTDRLLREPGPMRGHVIDFLEFPHWPVFNVADCAIVGSAALIAVLSLRGVELAGHDPARQVPGPSG